MSKVPYAGKVEATRVYKCVNVKRAAELRHIWADDPATRTWDEVGRMLAKEENREMPYNGQAVSRAVRRTRSV